MSTVNIYESSQHTKEDINTFFNEQTSPADYIQMSRLANLRKELFIPLVNCLLMGLITLQDVASIEILDSETVIAFLDETLYKNYLTEAQVTNSTYKNVVYDEEDPIDPTTENWLGLGEDYLVMATLRDRTYPRMTPENLMLRYELFIDKQNFRSYRDQVEFETEFQDKVLPTVLDSFIEFSVEDVFPEDPTTLFDTVTDQAIKERAMIKYSSLFKPYMKSLNNERCQDLIITSPYMISHAQSDPGTFASMLDWFGPEGEDWYIPYRNTKEVLDEIVSLMEKYEEDFITKNGQTYNHLHNSRIDEEFLGNNPSRALNRYILFTEVKVRVNGDINVIQELTAIDILIQKIEDFKKLVGLIYKTSYELQKVLPVK